MSGRGAPLWTAVAIGLLLGLLAGSVWLLLRDRQAPAVGPGPAAADGGAGVSPGAATAALPDTGTRADTAGGADAQAELATGRRNAIVRATEQASPAVVSISVVQHRFYRQRRLGLGDWERLFFSPRIFQRDVQSYGSGFICSEDGLVLTNRHVVEDADEIVVTLSDGRQFDALVLESIPRYDLALLQLAGIEGQELPLASFGDSDELQIGEWAIAIGSPFGYLLADTQPTVTVGVISALNRDIKMQDQSQETVYLGMIQTDAAINPGNSGGPLVNADGEVVGINTFIFTESGGSIGIGFAVPIRRAQWLIEEVRQYGRYRGFYSGIALYKLTPLMVQRLGLEDPVGYYVGAVEEDSPAARAGLQVGDIVRAINDQRLDSNDTVTRLIYEARVGTQLRFLAERDGQAFEGTIVLEEREH